MKVPTALAIAVVATLLLYVLPGGRILGRPLVLLSTFFHELGHGLSAILTGGRFDKLHVYANASGVAVFRARKSRFARAFVAAGGPLGPSVAAAGLFWAARTAKTSHVALGVLAGVFLVSALVWVRNAFGFVFVVLLGAGAAALAVYADDRAGRIACAFLAIQMGLSVFSRADELFRSRARTSAGTMASDTAQIADALVLPYWFWGALIALASFAAVGLGVWSFAETMR